MNETFKVSKNEKKGDSIIEKEQKHIVKRLGLTEELNEVLAYYIIDDTPCIFQVALCDTSFENTVNMFCLGEKAKIATLSLWPSVEDFENLIAEHLCDFTQVYEQIMERKKKDVDNSYSDKGRVFKSKMNITKEEIIGILVDEISKEDYSYAAEYGTDEATMLETAFPKMVKAAEMLVKELDKTEKDKAETVVRLVVQLPVVHPDGALQYNGRRVVSDWCFDKYGIELPTMSFGEIRAIELRLGRELTSLELEYFNWKAYSYDPYGINAEGNYHTCESCLDNFAKTFRTKTESELQQEINVIKKEYEEDEEYNYILFTPFDKDDDDDYDDGDDLPF